MHAKETVLVLGAGIQGSLIALEAAQRGFSVVIFDEADSCLSRASLRNEGKIHLGYVYANDPSFETADLMLRSAFSFAPIIDELLPTPFPWSEVTSNPFDYVVLFDSLVPKDVLYRHYDQVECRAREIQADKRLNYLGHRLNQFWKPVEVSSGMHAGRVDAVVRTPEMAVSLERLRQAVQDALEHHERIGVCFGCRVTQVERRDGGFQVSGVRGNGAPWSYTGDRVVNALWSGRLEMDEQMGLLPARPWVYRLKHRVVGRLPAALHDLQSMTIVLGKFGDVVTYPGTDGLYLSWYPTCMTGWSQAVIPPGEWQRAAAGTLPSEEQREIIQSTLNAFDEIIPGLGAMKHPHADGGVIFSWGSSDIDDLDSTLHQRSQIGVHAEDGYYSINTGKFTSAPYFAKEWGDMLA